MTPPPDMTPPGQPPRTRTLRLVLPGGELPRWLGEALTDLSRRADCHLQVRRASPGATAPPRSGALDRWWRRRLPPLHRWTGARWARDPLLAWAGGDGPPDITLLLDPRNERDAPAESTIWLLCDDDGRALSMLYPLLEALCAGRGLALQLLARPPGGEGWQPLARLHRAASSHYRHGLAGLARALSDLVGQALAADAAGGQGGGGGEARRDGDSDGGTESGKDGGRDSGGGGPPGGAACAAEPPACRGGAALRHGLAGWWRTWRARQRSLWFSEYWRIGVIDQPVARLLEAGPAPSPRWITPATRLGYWADPFGLPGHARRLSCEQFDERTGVGHLEVLELADDGGGIASRTRLAVGGGRHVSFPNVFELDGRRYGLAESVATRECVLHEVDENGAWRPLQVLLHDVAAADPVLFRWEGRCWLAFTDADLGDMDNLCLYHAETLDGPWQPHRRNPVKVDIRGARMAGGVFWHAGSLYRPAQDCLRTYGAAVVLHRLLRLDPEHFEEVAVRRLEPDPHGECPDGLHTLSAWGERTLVDGKRHGFNALAVWRKLRRRGAAGLRPLAPSVLPEAPGGRKLMVYLPDLRLGGGESSMLRLAGGLAQAGLSVELVVHDIASSDFALPPGVRATSLQVRGTAAALQGLVRHIRRTRPHWVLTAFPHTNVAAVLALALARSDARCVITEHAPLSRQIAQQARWRYRLLPPLVRWAYRRAHAVVAVSAGVRDDLQALIGAGVAPAVIHNPVLPADLESELAREPEHPWLLDDSLQVVISVSRLSREKDLATLVRAFAPLQRQRPSARLLLVGDGPERERLAALVAALGLGAAVELPGATPFPLRWMRRAAVLALPSLYEGFGNVLVEALACGTPVVSTDCPVGPREVLEGGRLGELVPPGDEAALGAALQRALQRGRVLPAGAQEAARRYTQAAACSAYQRLLETLYPNPASAGEGRAC